MSQPSRAYVVLTFSPQPAAATTLQQIVDAAGFACQASSSCEDLERHAADVMPDAVVYELSFPFSENWHHLVQVRSRPTLRCLPFVITTTDARELYRRVGVPALELSQHPNHLRELREALLGVIQAAA